MKTITEKQLNTFIQELKNNFESNFIIGQYFKAIIEPTIYRTYKSVFEVKNEQA